MDSPMTTECEALREEIARLREENERLRQVPERALAAVWSHGYNIGYGNGYHDVSEVAHEVLPEFVDEVNRIFAREL